MHRFVHHEAKTTLVVFLAYNTTSCVIVNFNYTRYSVNQESLFLGSTAHITYLTVICADDTDEVSGGYFVVDYSVGLNSSLSGSGDWIGAGVGLLDSFITNVTNSNIAGQNIKMQKETNAQNEALMRESWLRDDNAVQRRVADLKAAGLSPLLAAGAEAKNSGPIQLNAPHNDFKMSHAGILQALQLVEAAKNSRLQNESLEKDIELKQKQIDHYGESPFWKNAEYLIQKLWPFLSKYFGDGSDGYEDPFGLNSGNDPDFPKFNYDSGETFLGMPVVNRDSYDKQLNEYAEEVLDYKGYETRPNQSQEVVVSGHTYDVSDKFKSDARYFIDKALSDNMVSSKLLISLADTLSQRYNYDMNDVLDYLFDLWDELHGSR